MLKEVAFQNKSVWWVYKSLRRLEKEKYLQKLPRGINLEQELWTITDHGFEIVLMDRDDIKEYRYRAHAPAHDYFATCLQLGDLWQINVEKDFYTEQMLASLSPRAFPQGFKNDSGHVPDGVTVLYGGVKEAIIGYEVDLNLKDETKYHETRSYYDYKVKSHLVIWLVKNAWIANRILKEISFQGRPNEIEQQLKKYAFVLTEDFKKRIWEAEVILGPMKGLSIRKLHANLLQSLDKSAPNMGQKPMQEIFFPKFRSPQKSFTYKIGGEAESY
jgi:hypothetical protein